MNPLYLLAQINIQADIKFISFPEIIEDKMDYKKLRYEREKRVGSLEPNN